MVQGEGLIAMIIGRMGGCYWVDRIYTLRDEVEYGTGADR